MRNDHVPGFREDDDDTFVCVQCGHRFVFSEWANANPSATDDDVERIMTWGLADHRASCHVLDA